MSHFSKILITIVSIILFVILFGMMVIKKGQSGNSIYIAISAICFFVLVFVLKAVWKESKNKSQQDEPIKKEFKSDINNYSTNLQLLKDSLDNGVISEPEYKSKINDLEEERKKQQHLEEEEKKIKKKKILLDTLLSKGLLTQQDYDEKLQKLDNVKRKKIDPAISRNNRRRMLR